MLKSTAASRLGGGGAQKGSPWGIEVIVLRPIVYGRVSSSQRIVAHHGCSDVVPASRTG